LEWSVVLASRCGRGPARSTSTTSSSTPARFGSTSGSIRITTCLLCRSRACSC
jgi:hypothetical protein